MQQHCQTKRNGVSSGGGSKNTSKHSIPIIHVANFDPAAEYFTYEPIFDIRDVISVEEVMEELSLGPNGALLYCMEYVLDHHLDTWLREELETMDDDDYLFIDCPGQMELYTHIPIQKRILDTIRLWGYEGKMVSVFCIDATFCCSDSYKLLSGNLLSLSTMIALELPHVTLLTKCDLMAPSALERILSDYTSAAYVHQLDQNQQSLLVLHDHEIVPSSLSSSSLSRQNHPENDDNNDDYDENYHEEEEEEEEIITPEDRNAAKEFTATVTNNEGNVTHEGNIATNICTTRRHNNNNDNNNNNKEDRNNYLQQLEQRRMQRHQLTSAIAQIVDDYSMVGYLPLNIYDEDSCDHVLYTVSQCIQYGEDHDVYTGGDDDDNNNNNDDNHYETPDHAE
jgi:GTPase SAR1 family protein